HEVGHAIQHATAYSWLGMRSKLVPVVSIASKYSQYVIMGGIALAAASAFGSTVLLIGIIMYAAGTLFAFVTLPVEYDASNRALAWLENENMLTQEEHAGAKDALKWAARTYLVAAIGSLATLLYFVSIFLKRR
ncbi:zinc metallopeptidase, partial [Nonlabens mediterrranea]|nr:zinc metallopeptidase [Nonlabens mediterrranea]